MKFLQSLTRFIQAFLLFILPLILFYWFLVVLNIVPLKSLMALFGAIFDPFINTVRIFLHYELSYNHVKIDFTPLIASGVILATYFIFSMIDNLLGQIDDSIKKTKEDYKKAEIKRQEEQMHNNYLEALALNKIIYLVLKLKISESSSAYLFCKEDDIFSEGLTNTVLTNIIEASSKYEAKRYKDFENPEHTYNFIFYSITNAIDYSFYVYNKVLEANKNIIDPSIRVTFTIACSCSYSENTAEKDFAITHKVLCLGTNGEIVVTELFKEKYEALKEESNLIFESKGIYNINDRQLETFRIKLTQTT